MEGCGGVSEVLGRGVQATVGYAIRESTRVLVMSRGVDSIDYAFAPVQSFDNTIRDGCCAVVFLSPSAVHLLHISSVLGGAIWIVSNPLASMIAVMFFFFRYLEFRASFKIEVYEQAAQINSSAVGGLARYPLMLLLNMPRVLSTSDSTRLKAVDDRTVLVVGHQETEPQAPSIPYFLDVSAIIG